MFSRRLRISATVLLPIVIGSGTPASLDGPHAFCGTCEETIRHERTCISTCWPPNTVVREYTSEDVEARIAGGGKEIWRHAQIHFSIPELLLSQPSALEVGFGQPCSFVITGLRGGDRSRVHVTQTSILSWSRGDGPRFFRKTRELARIDIPDGVLIKLIVEFGHEDSPGNAGVVTSVFTVDIVVTGLDLTLRERMQPSTVETSEKTARIVFFGPLCPKKKIKTSKPRTDSSSDSSNKGNDSDREDDQE